MCRVRDTYRAYRAHNCLQHWHYSTAPLFLSLPLRAVRAVVCRLRGPQIAVCHGPTHGPFQSSIHFCPAPSIDPSASRFPITVDVNAQHATVCANASLSLCLHAKAHDSYRFHPSISRAPPLQCTATLHCVLQFCAALPCATPSRPAPLATAPSSAQRSIPTRVVTTLDRPPHRTTPHRIAPRRTNHTTPPAVFKEAFNVPPAINYNLIPSITRPPPVAKIDPLHVNTKLVDFNPLTFLYIPFHQPSKLLSAHVPASRSVAPFYTATLRYTARLGAHARPTEVSITSSHLPQPFTPTSAARRQVVRRIQPVDCLTNQRSHRSRSAVNRVDCRICKVVTTYTTFFQINLNVPTDVHITHVNSSDADTNASLYARLATFPLWNPTIITGVRCPTSSLQHDAALSTYNPSVAPHATPCSLVDFTRTHP